MTHNSASLAARAQNVRKMAHFYPAQTLQITILMSNRSRLKLIII